MRRNWMQRMGWRRRLRRGRCVGRCARARSLADLPAGAVGLVACNTDRRTAEMGFFPGCRLRVLHNEPDDLNMVVAVDDARYALAKHNARQIRIR